MEEKWKRSGGSFSDIRFRVFQKEKILRHRVLYWRHYHPTLLHLAHPIAVRGLCISRTGRRAKTRLTISKGDFREEEGGGQEKRARPFGVASATADNRYHPCCAYPPLSSSDATPACPPPFSASWLISHANVDNVPSYRECPRILDTPYFRISGSPKASNRAQHFSAQSVSL